MIQLKSIIIEGFGSIIEPITYKLDYIGINSLVGPNGVGKSTIINALCWVIYKQLAKKGSSIEPWPQVIDKNFKGTRVELLFCNGKEKWGIIRCKDYAGRLGDGKKGKNRLVVFNNQDGSILHKLRDKSDQQKWINEKFGFSFELFKNTIMFGQALTRLNEEDGPTKKKVFDEAFDTLFINRAREIASKKLDELNTEYNDEFVKGTMLKTFLEQSQDEYNRSKKIIENFENSRKEKISQLIIEKDKLRFELKKVDTGALKKDLEELQQKFDDGAVSNEFMKDLAVNKAKSEIEKLELETKSIRGKINRLKDTCETCGQKINTKQFNKIKNQLKEQLEAKMNLLDISNKELSKAVKEHKRAKKRTNKVEEMGKIIKEKESVLNEAKLQEIKNQSIQERIEEKKQEIQEQGKLKMPEIDLKALKKKRDRNKRRFEESGIKLKDLNKKVEIQKWLINDPLSNSGLRAYIFDSMLVKVNQCLNQYSDLVGFRANIYVDMSTAHKNIDISIFKRTNEVPYKDLSGGQKQMVDITLAFALNDVVTQIKPINTLFLDEVFESLDKTNIEIVESLINEKAKTRSIHLISHQSGLIPNNSHRIELSLNSKGQTILV